MNTTCVGCSNNLICTYADPSQNYHNIQCPRCRERVVRFYRNSIVRVPNWCCAYPTLSSFPSSAASVLPQSVWANYIYGSKLYANDPRPTMTSYESVLAMARQRFCMDCAPVEAKRVYKELLESVKKAR